MRRTFHQLEVTAKGFGSENMSQLKVLTPAAGVKGVKEFVVETVKKAGPNPARAITCTIPVRKNIGRDKERHVVAVCLFSRLIFLRRANP